MSINISLEQILVRNWPFCGYRVACPNFGHPAQTSSFTKYDFLQVKNYFATIVNVLSVLQLVIYYFRSMPIASTKCVNLE